MEKILLAVGNREMEEYLKKTLMNEVQFVGETVYREGVLRAIGQTGPSLVILRDALKGSTDMLTLIYDIRANYPEVRVLFIGIDRDEKDPFYGNLVNYGVYDLVVGGRVSVNEIIGRIRTPSRHSDAKHFQPAPNTKPLDNRAAKVAPISILEDEADDEDDDMLSIEPAKPAVPEKSRVEEEPAKEEKRGLFSKITGRNPGAERGVEPKVQDIAPEPIEKPVPTPKPVSKLTPTPEVKEEEKKEEVSTEGSGRFGFLKKESKSGGVAQRILGMQDVELSKDKIITFMGGRSGVGTTSLAVNTAFGLAAKGNRVLYMEVNQRHPSATYWYDTGLLSHGIDTALHAIKDKRYADVAKAIVKTEDLRKREGAMRANYRKFPEGLDFMSYSREYLLGLVQREAATELKELYLYLMYQEGYDYVIVDLSFFADDRDIQGAILYSNKVFTVLNQDVSTVGYHLANMSVLEQEGVLISKKNIYVVNSYLRSKFGEKDMKEWLDVKNLVLVPQSTGDLSECNAKGMPVIIASKRSGFSASVQEIISIIGGKK